MIKCPSCGYENVDGTQFCEGCGEELPANSAAAAAPAAAAATGGDQTIKCPACDNLNPAENLVCEVCGTELRPGADAGGADPFDASSFGAPTTGSTTPFDTALNTPDAAPPSTGLATVPDADTSANAANTADAPAAAANTADAFATTPSAPTPDAASAAVATSSDATAPAVGGASSDVSSLGGSAPSVTDTGAGSIPDLAAPAATDAVPAASGAAPAAGGDLQPGRVKLTVEQGMSVGKQFVLGDNEMQVGREDEEEGIYPDLDLSDQDEGYVHRRHATLNFNNGQLTVTHLGGANKTRVNNRPLPDNQPQPVNIGDKIAFGKVVLRVQPHP